MIWKENNSSSSLPDKDFDSLFRNATGPEIPAFQEEFWTEMEALLPEKKRRKIGFWMIAALLVGASSVFATAYIFTRPESGISTIKVASEAGVSETEVTTKNTVQLAHKEVSNPVESSNQSFDLKTDRAIQSTNFNTSQQENQNSNTINNTDVDLNNSENTTKVLSNEELHTSVTEPVEVVEVNEDSEINEAVEVTESLRYLPLTISTAYSPTTYLPTRIKTERFYWGARVGIGQSLLRTPTTTSNLSQSYALELGIFKRIGNMVLTTGVATRMDASQNVRHTDYVNDPASSFKSTVQLKQIYSVEFPLSMGYNSGRHSISMQFNPGIQVLFSGEETKTNLASQEVYNRQKINGEIKDSKSLTMELGANYQFNLQPNWYLGLGANADIIRPFNTNVYEGMNRTLPLNIQLGIRRTF